MFVYIASNHCANMKEYEKMNVGKIVTDSFANAHIFNKYGIDFCCNGSDSLAEACRKRNVLKDLESSGFTTSGKFEFKEWPLDLLCDYILKFHHRNVCKQAPEIIKLLDKVSHIHGEQHPELFTVKNLFSDSLESLYNHLEKRNKFYPLISIQCMTLKCIRHKFLLSIMAISRPHIGHDGRTRRGGRAIP